MICLQIIIIQTNSTLSPQFSYVIFCFQTQYGYIYTCLKHALEHQADFLKGDAKAAERLARQDLYPLTRRDSTFPEIDNVT